MLQIIGWLGCVYLFIKALEIASGSGHRNENGDLRSSAMAACGLAWFGSVGFAIWIFVQGSALHGQLEAAAPSSQFIGQTPEEIAGPLPEEVLSKDLTDAQVECIRNAKSDEAILACK